MVYKSDEDVNSYFKSIRARALIYLKSKTIEEYLINKDLAGYKNKHWPSWIDSFAWYYANTEHYMLVRICEVLGILAISIANMFLFGMMFGPGGVVAGGFITGIALAVVTWIANMHADWIGNLDKTDLPNIRALRRHTCDDDNLTFEALDSMISKQNVNGIGLTGEINLDDCGCDATDDNDMW